LAKDNQTNKIFWVIFCDLYIENHPTDQLRSAGSNPVGTAKDNAKEPIQMVGFFVVFRQSSPKN
jgi:hypothetical protein